MTFEYRGTDTTHLFNLVHFRHVKVCGSALHLRPRTDPDPSHDPKASSTLAPGSVCNSFTILDAENHNNNFNSTDNNNNASDYNDNNNNNHCKKDKET